MKIKRTFAPTMREALALVKQEQGADAVILGNKKVWDGVEIISAIDYDESIVNGEQSNDGEASTHAAALDAFDNQPNAAVYSQQTKPNTQVNTDILSDSWVGPLVTEEQNGRREPVLGPVAGVRQKAVVESPKAPAWLEKAFEQAEKTSRPALAQANPSRSASVVEPKPSPIKTTTRKIAARKTATSGIKKSPKQVNLKAKSIQQDIQNEPMISEVRTELKGLRDLMQSQLSVLQWDQFTQRHPVRTVLLNLMSELGLGSDICEIIISHLDELNHDPHKVWQQALGILAKCLPANRTNILSNGGRIALVGSTGVGKTTTIAKIAARFAHIHGKRSVAMISTDHYKIGAQEQLQHFAQLIQLPLLTANTSEELSDRLDMLSDKKLVLIDTAGMSQRDLGLSERFHLIQNSVPQIKPYLVLSANTQLAALNQTIEYFSKVQLAGAIVTKLDEAASLGGIMTVSIRHQLPLTYCGVGQRVPEDLELAKVHRIISKAVALMKDYSETEDPETLAVRFNDIASHNSNRLNNKLAKAGL